MKISIFLSIFFVRFLPKGPIDNKSAFIQVLACGQIGDIPLHEQMMTHFIDIWHN